MSEENIMLRQVAAQRVIKSNARIPYAVIASDVEEMYLPNYSKELDEIANYYDIYKFGNEFYAEGANNYIPSDLKYKKAANILNKEARFCFASPPDFTVSEKDTDTGDETKLSQLQEFLDAVLSRNKFNAKLIKACKDCFIGKRVAIVVNFNNTTGVSVVFLNAFEFLYEVGENEEIVKFISVSKMKSAVLKDEEQWIKKRYELIDGKVYLEEKIFDGLGKELKKIYPRSVIKLKRIPAVVVLNDGLTGDRHGESEISYLLDYESTYSKMANGDIDAMRKGMNPVRYTIDASDESTENLSVAPGAFWDLQSNDEQAQPRQARAGVLEPSMSFSEPLKKTLDRIENTMYSEVDVPNINSEQLQGVITSGKTLRALYWGLTVRCDEKMLTWIPALTEMAEIILEGAAMYPDSISRYTLLPQLPQEQYKIVVENNYPLPQDTEEEKNVDLAEIEAKVMSRKTYMRKWGKMSAKKAESELQQIKMEMDYFDNSQFTMPPVSRGQESQKDFSLGENQQDKEETEKNKINVIEWGG